MDKNTYDFSNITIIVKSDLDELSTLVCKKAVPYVFDLLKEAADDFINIKIKSGNINSHDILKIFDKIELKYLDYLKLTSNWKTKEKREQLLLEINFEHDLHRLVRVMNQIMFAINSAY
jgi:hypothetical protein